MSREPSFNLSVSSGARMRGDGECCRQNCASLLENFPVEA
jgi:hypothetical protein